MFAEKPKGVDFARSAWPYPEDSDNVRYERTPLPLVKRMVEKTIPKTARILDVGCGKGYFIYCLKKMGYLHVDGLEYNKKLFKIAHSNFDKLGLTDIKLFHSDAAEFKELDNYDTIYLFNPFQSVVMISFMKRLEASLKRKPRDLMVVYLNPVEHRIWNASLMFDLTESRIVRHLPHCMQVNYYTHRAHSFAQLESFVRVLKHHYPSKEAAR